MEKVIEPVEVVKETTPAVKVEETIGEALKPREDTVPLSKFLELKTENKAAKRDIADLQSKIKDGATKNEISKGIKEIADEHNVDENFLMEFANTIKAQAESGIDNKIAEKLKPLQDEDNAKKIDNIFNTSYDKVIETMPEYKDIVNKAVIKTLALDPANKNKTFTKIIEESYGHLVKGVKTIDASTPDTRDKDQTLDKSKLKDPTYMKSVLADKVLKEEYNKGLIDRLNM